MTLRRQLEFLRRAQPFALTWARLFYMYGKGQPSTSLYSQLAMAVQRGDSAFGMSQGDQMRDFLPIADVAHLIADLALRCHDAGIVNVCSGKPISVRALVEHLQALNGWNIALDLGKHSYQQHEPLAFWGSTERLRSLIGATHSGSAV
jgi:nucleoside-diphosphate-sugar epimerase